MTHPTISPDGHWRWDGAQWVPNVGPQPRLQAQPTRPGRGEWIAGGVVGAAVLAPVIFPDAGAEHAIGLGSSWL